MKKNILFVMPALFLGGAETQFRYILKSLDKDKYKVTVATIDPIEYECDFVKANNEIEFLYLDVNLRYYREKYKDKKIRKRLRYILLYIKIIKRLLKEFKQNKYSVVIGYHMFFAPLIPIFKLLGSKVIFSERTAQQTLIKRKYLSLFYNKADKMTCNSDYTAELLNKINVKNVKVIYNGIGILEEDLVIPKKIENIYIIARISPDKNQMIALKAFRKISNKKLYLVGKIDNKDYYDELIKAIKHYKLEDRVELIQYTHNIVEIYNKADLIVLPSYEEGMANVLLESFLHKKYCIASNIPTNKFLLKDGRGGLFNPNIEDELITQINYYEELDDNKKETIITKNYKYLVENFSLSKMISQYEELINKLIKEEDE